MSGVGGIYLNGSKYKHVTPQTTPNTKDNPKIVHVARFKMARLSKEDMLSKQLAFLEKRIQINEALLKQSAQLFGLIVGAGFGGMAGAGVSYFMGIQYPEMILTLLSYSSCGAVVGCMYRTINAEAYLQAWNDQYKNYVKKLDDFREDEGLRQRKMQSRKSNRIE